MKKLLSDKLSIEEGLELVKKGKTLHIDIRQTSESLRSFIARMEIEEKEKMKQQRLNKQPVKIMLNNLIDQLSYPLKSKNLEKMVERWYISAMWQEKAKAFVKDRRIENVNIMRKQLI